MCTEIALRDVASQHVDKPVSANPLAIAGLRGGVVNFLVRVAVVEEKLVCK
jgi:hypothetical protein